MSHLADITKTFRNFSEKYNWSKEETTENMLDILSDCEWSLPIIDVKDEKGNIDYEATAIAEYRFVHKLLWD